MPNKTIYVSDDDLPMLEEAQQLSGANLSSTIAAALRQFVLSQQAREQGFRDITVRVGSLEGTQRQRFRGRRLARWRHVSAQSRRAELFSVYRTEKGRFAVHVQRGPEWIGWNDPEDEGWSVHMMAAWRERMAHRMRLTGQLGQPGQPGPHQPAPPGGSPWDAWRESWPTSGGNATDFGGPVEAVLEVNESIDEMRERYPAELCDLVVKALDTPGIEELDI